MILEILIALAIATFSIVLTSSSLHEMRVSSINNILTRETMYDAQETLELARAGTTTKEFFRRDITPCAFVAATSTYSVLITSPSNLLHLGFDCHGVPDIIHTPQFALFRTQSLSTASSTSLDVENGIAFIGSEQGLNGLGTESGVNAIDVTHNRAFMAMHGSSNQFITINISDPHTPTIIATSTLPGVTGSFPSGLSIFYYDDKVYVGTHRTAGREFHVYDVSHNTSQWLGSIELNHNINSIAVQGKYAFLGTSGNIRNIIILDISDPARIVKISELSFVGSEDTTTVYLLGTTLYAGRKKSTVSTHHEFAAINVSNPFLPFISRSLYINSHIVSLQVRDNLAFIAMTNKIRIIDLADPLFKVVFEASHSDIVDIDYENSILYVLTKNMLHEYSII